MVSTLRNCYKFIGFLYIRALNAKEGQNNLKGT